MDRLTHVPRTLVVALLLAGNPGVLGGQQARPALSTAAAREDFTTLTLALEEAHGGFDRFASREDVIRRLARHLNRIDQPVSQVEFAGIVSEAIAELRDGHARLELDSVTTASLAAAKVFPLRLSMEGTRLVVRFNDSQDTTIVPGMEIVNVNGRSAADITRLLWPKISADGFIETGKRRRLGQQFPTLYWLFVEQPSSYAIVAHGPQGKVVRVTLPGISEADRRLAANPVNAAITAQLQKLDSHPGPIALEFIEKPAVALLRVRSFSGQAFIATLDSAFNVLRERGTSALILDLRGNGGGVDQFGARLVSQLVDKPFRYFDYIRVTTIAPSFATWLPRTFDEVRAGTVPDPAGGFRVTRAMHSGIGEQEPAANAFKGRLFVLIDGGSFSTTADVAAQLKSLKRAVFIGEETAGTYEGNTSGLNAAIVLPNSRLRLRIMMYGYWNAVTPVAGGRGVIPDHAVPLRISDILAGRDPAIDLARRLAR